MPVAHYVILRFARSDEWQESERRHLADWAVALESAESALRNCPDPDAAVAIVEITSGQVDWRAKAGAWMPLDIETRIGKAAADVIMRESRR